MQRCTNNKLNTDIIDIVTYLLLFYKVDNFVDLSACGLGYHSMKQIANVCTENVVLALEAVSFKQE